MRLFNSLFITLLLLLNQNFTEAQSQQNVTGSIISGLRTALIVRINFSDKQVSCSADQMADLMWRKAPSVTGLFESSSFGKLSFQSDANQDGNADVVSVTLNESLPNTCNWTFLNNWSSQALAQVSAQGINPDLFQYKIFVLPSEAACGPGHSRSNGANGWYIFIKYCDAGDLIAHEIGHHLGMGHAQTDLNNDGNSDSEYGDNSCIMGYSVVGWRHFNALHKLQMGWIPESSEVVGYAGNTYRLLATEQDPNLAGLTDGAVQVLKVPISNSEQSNYFLSLRIPLDGYSAKLSYPNRVHLHRLAEDSSITRLVTTIGVGETYFDGMGTSFTVSNLEPPYVSVAIASVTATPIPTSTPTAIPTRQFSILIQRPKLYNSTIKLRVVRLSDKSIVAVRSGKIKRIFLDLQDGEYQAQILRKGFKNKIIKFIVGSNSSSALTIKLR